MKLRQAIKIRERMVAGYDYRKSTSRRSTERLSKADMPTWHDLWFCGLMDKMHEEDPVGLAGFQFQCGIKLQQAKARRSPCGG